MSLTIDRLAIDDVGGNPKRLAQAIVAQLPKTEAPIPVRDIAVAMDIYDIREELLDGLEGGLITSRGKSEGAILVHRDRPETRKRYTIAHELGHYVNPFHEADSQAGFRCRAQDMAVTTHASNNRSQKMEAQANEFAAELLMPDSWIRSLLRPEPGPDIAQIVGIAARFNVSREAAARRYVDLWGEPIAVVFSRHGRIRYVKARDFPRLSVWNGMDLPQGCFSLASPDAVGLISDWVGVEADIWLEPPLGFDLYEQSLAQRNGYRLTLLTAEPRDDDDTWDPPNFR